jgi:hypothetical protein
MAKVLRCSSCGAGLRPTAGQPNVVCEYCNSFVRVADDKAAAQFETTVILSQMMQIWPRVRSDDFTGTYETINELIGKHKYVEARSRLNRILEKDHTQARAWFYKALLPILEQDTILFKGCYINIVTLSQIVKRDEVRMYLKHCGLPKWRHREFLDYYRSTDFLYEQQIKFLDKAIENASTEERKEYFQIVKKQRIKFQKKRIRRKWAENFGLILILGVVVVGVCAIIWYGIRNHLVW